MNPIIPLVAVGGILLFLDSIPRVGFMVSSFFLTILFLFASARLDTELGIFYTIMITATVGWRLKGIGEQDVSKVSLFGTQYSGWLYSGLMVGIGIMLYLIMRSISIAKGGFIIGVPSLAAAPSEVLTSLNPMLVAALGYIENRFFFVVFDVVRKYVFPFIPIPVISTIPIIGPLFLTALGFGFFHSIFLSGFVIFAAMVMAIWIMMFLLGMPEATNIAHYIWNGSIQLAKIGVRI